MKNILLKRQLELKSKLKELQARAKADDVTTEELVEINTTVEEVTTDLAETNEALEKLDDDDSDINEDPEDNDLDDGDPDDGEDTNANDEGADPVDPAERNRALAAIKRGLQQEPQKNKNKKLRSAFVNFLAGRIDESQARSFGIEFHNGKVLVPEDLSKEVISYLQEENPIRKQATVHKTKGTQGFPVQVKKADANTVEKERDASKLIPFTEIEFDDVYLAPIEFDAIIKVTKKLTHMSDFDVEAIVIEELKKAYLRQEVAWYVSATNNPGSLVNKAVKFTPVAGTTNKYLQLVQLKNVLPTAFRSKAVWDINRAAQTELESILDDNGRPILKAIANSEFEFTLFNYPVVVSDYFDDETDKTKSVIYFGDMSNFHIQDVLGTLELEKLDQLFARENKVGYKIYHINDGQLIYGPFETPVYSFGFVA